MDKTKIAINGFGRIGRQIFRINAERGYPLNIVAVNDLGDINTAAHLLKYDSNYGKFDKDIQIQDQDTMIVDGQKVEYLHEKDPAALPWKDLGVEIVIESTGVFRDREGASKHLQAGASKVIISAPAKEPDASIVIGVNDDTFNKEAHNIISNASCTTNCMAPIVKVMNDTLGIDHGMMTTIHSYTNDQRILDLPHKDMRRARAAAVSMIPTTTGAAKAVCEVIPELKGKLTGMAIRVPTPVVSILDFTFVAKKETTADEVNSLLKEAANGKLKDILAVTDEELVSIDYRKDSHSAIIDAPSTQVMEGNMVKILAWYDNEWGYSNRTLELAELIAKQL